MEHGRLSNVNYPLYSGSSESERDLSSDYQRRRGPTEVMIVECDLGGAWSDNVVR